ncbi:Melanopsin [Strongyloides ratti]|uniref:Melanopsin n=1 Tax=Strongyloides ratti TaxID=34506 RepID=A0A090LLS1_STRRB|nr:Melanopsin [Strongyloides ratti]CEF69113.1 Melanopsin [Strongyloides ratti]
MKEPICTIHAFAISTLSVGGIHQLTLLSFERYVGVNHPFVSMKVSLKTKVLFATGAFVWTLLTTTPPLFGWSRYKVLDDSLHYCVFDYLSKEKSSQLYILYLFLNAYIIPLSIIGFSNYKIFLAAKGVIKNRKVIIHKKYRHSQSSKTSNVYENSELSIKLDNISKNEFFNNHQYYHSLLIYKKQQRKCSRVIFYCVGSFVISWTPYAFTSIVSNIIFNTRMNKNVVILTAVAAKMFVIWNPIIYGLMDRTFKNECIQIFSKIFK